MEFSNSFSVLLASISVMFIFTRLLLSPKTKQNFPPGPKTLPIIGNLHQLTGALPHHCVTSLCKKFGPVMKLHLGEIVAVVISSPEAAKEVLKTSEIKFAQRPEVYAVEIMSYDHSSLVFSPYNEYWRQLRKISVLELLSTKRVQSFRKIREEEVWDLVEFVSSSQGSEINLSDRIFAMTGNVVARAAFGKKCEDQKDFTLLLAEIVRLAGGFNLADLYPSVKFLRTMSGMKPALMKIHKKIDRILEDLVNDHKLRRKENSFRNVDSDEDLLDTLLNYGEEDKFDFRLTVNQIKAIVMVKEIELM